MDWRNIANDDIFNLWAETPSPRLFDAALFGLVACPA